jgi:hypothetical protein
MLLSVTDTAECFEVIEYVRIGRIIVIAHLLDVMNVQPDTELLLMFFFAQVATDTCVAVSLQCVVSKCSPARSRVVFRRFLSRLCLNRCFSWLEPRSS